MLPLWCPYGALMSPLHVPPFAPALYLRPTSRMHPRAFSVAACSRPGHPCMCCPCAAAVRAAGSVHILCVLLQRTTPHAPPVEGLLFAPLGPVGRRQEPRIRHQQASLAAQAQALAAHSEYAPLLVDIINYMGWSAYRERRESVRIALSQALHIFESRYTAAE